MMTKEMIRNTTKGVSYSDDWPNVFVKLIKMLRIGIKNKKVATFFSFPSMMI